MQFKTAAKNLVITSALLLIPAFAFGQNNKKSSPPPAPAARSAPAAPSRPAQAAQRPSTPNSQNAQRPGTASGTGRGPNTGSNAGAMNNNRGMNNTRTANTAAGTNTNRGGANNPRVGGNAGSRPSAAPASRTTATAARRGPPTTTREIKTRSGASVQASYKGGRVRSIETRGMKIQRSANGQRRIETTRNGRTVVSTGKGRGYMQRAYLNRNGRTYVQRTYVVGGRTYVYAYHSYYYGGVAYYGYAPAYYYHPVYYGWAYNPWPAPVYYNWGYYGAPWYGYYGYYYAPYPAYPAASLWLTDYLIAENLRLAYEASLAAKSAPLGNPFAKFDGFTASLWSSDYLISGKLTALFGPALPIPAGKDSGNTSQAQLSPEVKQELADEIKQQIAADKSASEGTQQAANKDEVPPALDPKHRVFVVYTNLDVTKTADGDECQISQGDILERGSDTADADNNVEMVVKSAKKDDCPVGTHVAVGSSDLQEMHNHFREMLDAGIKSLADKSGKDGLPAAPDTSTKAGEVPPPSPDTNTGGELQQQQSDADQVEADVPKQDSGS